MKIGYYEAIELKRNFYCIPVKGACNIGVAIRGDTALVIDSGRTPEDGFDVVSGLRDHGIKPELLFITHYHEDHTFGAQGFSCPIYSSEATLKTMKECLYTHWSREEIRKHIKESPSLTGKWKDLVITFPTHTFSESMEYDFQGTTVRFMELGGHAPGASAVYFPEEKVLFPGELVFGERYPLLMDYSDPEKLIFALKKICTMDIDCIAPGHGEVCKRSMASKLVEYYQCLVDECRRLNSKGLAAEKVPEVLANCCSIPAVSRDPIRHRQNVSLVLEYLNK